MTRLSGFALTVFASGAGILTAATAADASPPQDRPPTTTIALADEAPPRGGGARYVPEPERWRWLAVIHASGVTAYLENMIWGGKGFYAQARDLNALIAYLDRQIVDGTSGLYRIGAFHTKHKEVGPKRRDYRSDRGVFGIGSLQIVVSRATGTVFLDMDRFSPYEDVTSFFGHSWEVIRNRLGIGTPRPCQPPCDPR